MTDRYEKTPSPEVQAEVNYAHTVPDECETVHWRGQILSMNELAALAQQPAPVGVDAAKDKAEFYRTERNKNHRKAERLEEALRDLLDQLEGIGIYIPGEDSGQWAGTEGLSFTQAEAALQPP